MIPAKAGSSFTSVTSAGSVARATKPEPAAAVVAGRPTMIFGPAPLPACASVFHCAKASRKAEGVP